MRSWLLATTLLISCICHAGELSTPPQDDDAELMFMMPFSIVHGPAEEIFEIHYRSHNGSMIVNGRVNGIPIRFVVDTGASLVSIPPGIAKQAGIAASERNVRLQTANGIVSAPLVEINQVIADQVSISNVKGVIQQVSSESDIGLLGMSFFGKHKMIIDHDRSTIILEPK